MEWCRHRFKGWRQEDRSVRDAAAPACADDLCPHLLALRYMMASAVASAATYAVAPTRAMPPSRRSIVTALRRASGRWVLE